MLIRPRGGGVVRVKKILKPYLKGLAEICTIHSILQISDLNVQLNIEFPKMRTCSECFGLKTFVPPRIAIKRQSGKKNEKSLRIAKICFE